MIYDKLENISRYQNLNKNFDKAIKWLSNLDLNHLPEGVFEIDGKKVYGFHVDVEGYDDLNKQYEVHQVYADLHIVVDEREKFYYLYESELTHNKNDYSQENDVQLFELPNERNLLAPKKHEFLLFLPKEGHVPKYISSRDKFKKFVLKIQW